MPKDLRKLRTEQLLENALIELMQKKNVHTITIKELTECAKINRVTFYAHYEDMPHFLQKKIDEILDGMVPMEARADSYDELLRSGTALEHYLLFFQYVKKHKILFQSMMGANGLPEFRQRMIDQGISQYRKILRPYLESFEDAVSQDMLVSYIVSAHIGMMEYWLMNDTRYSSEYMASQLEALTFKGILRQFHLLKD